MITFEKQENGVLFTFENSDKYLYGDGTILVPFNSLAVIQDESDMITLRKSASWDIFLSGRYDTDFNYGSKEDAVDALKEALFDETGISEEEVQQMIDAATSGIPSSQVIEQLRTDVNAVSGDVSTLQDDVASKADASAVTAVNDALTAHTANTSIHVTSTDKSNWDAKQDALTAGENITISGNVISAENNIIELTQEEYDALTEKDPDALYIITNAQEINMNDYATKTDLDAKADASALTAVSDAVTGKADASALTAVANDVQTVSGQVATKVETSDFNAFSAATDARIAEDEEVTAAALNDLAEGKQDTLISGENIKTINNISLLGSGNITISGGSGGGDYQYYSEDTVNESATIEVGEQSLTVDGNGVYVNNSPVVTAEELDDNYYTQEVIDEKEEVIASALTELNLRLAEDEEVTAAALNDMQENKADTSALDDYYEKVSGLTIEFNEGNQSPKIFLEKESEGIRYENIMNDGGFDSYQEMEDGSSYDTNFGYGTIGQTAFDQPESGISSNREFQITTDGFIQMTENTDDNEGYSPYRSESNFNYETGLEMNNTWTNPDQENVGEFIERSSRVTINSQKIPFIELADIQGNVTRINTTGITINDGQTIASEDYVDAALSGKADTSAVTAVQQSLSGKQDTLVSGTNIKTINNQSLLGSGNITISGGGGSYVYYTEDTSSESATIKVQNDDGAGNLTEKRVFVDGGDIIIESYNETDDGEGNTGTTDTQVDINSLGLSIIAYSDDGIDTTQTELEVQPMGAYINSEPIATEPYVDAALSGKADTSAVTAIANDVTVLSGAVDDKQDALSAGTGISISNNVISTSGVVFSQTVTQLVKLTQVAYDNLVTKDANTLYIISD